MHRRYWALSIILNLVLFNHSKAQSVEDFGAKEFFEFEDYNRALTGYLDIYKKNKEDIDVNIRIGICYLKVNDDKTKAIPYLEYAYKKGEYKDELLLQLGLAYMYAYKFDEAIRYFNSYRAKIKSNAYPYVDHLIENCENAKVLVKKPINVTFENLGKHINTKFPEYYPFVTKDHGKLYFTSSRSTNAAKIQSSEGYFTSDIYFSTVKRGEWLPAKSIGPAVNTVEDEQCVYITPDGQTMIVYIDNEEMHGDLFITSLQPKGKSFPKIVPLGEPINTNDLELEGCIFEDGNTMIISSNRAGGLGETDLYKFKKLPNGLWSQPQSLGSNVNTKYKEAFPVYDEKSQILYFASEGHTNLGGFDIFKSKFDEATQTFGQAINMGYPINTPENNIEFTLTENGRDGYIAAVRKEGLGDLDIYKVVFNEVESRPSVLKGIISKDDTLKTQIDAFITLVNEKTKEEIDSKNANPETGKYLFAVEPGTYILTIISPDFADITETITVFDKSDYVFEIEKNFVLRKPQAVVAPATEKTKPPAKKQ